MSDSAAKLLNNPYGHASFDLFRPENRAFADKSGLIKYLDDTEMSSYPVLLRPRRFGKSTFLQMLKCYYDIAFSDRYEELFSGTHIYDEALPSHNSYHVINFDFSSVPATNQNILVTNFSIAVLDGIQDFKRRYPDFIFSTSNADKSDPTAIFSEFCIAYAGYSKRKNLYLLIDEYDNFANELLSTDLNLFKRITSNDGFLKAFYAAVKKQTNSCIARTFITGVSSVSLDSLTSGFNIALNVTSFECFNDYAGFTESDLEFLIPSLIDVKNLGVTTSDVILRMKPVYDGYCFSSEAHRTVFNPSMCLYYLTKVRQKKTLLNPEDYPDPACDQDSTRLEQLFRLADKETADLIIDRYLEGAPFYLRKLSENINLNQVREYSREQLLSMLYYLGYLTVNPAASDYSSLSLVIPNQFMSNLFARCTIDFRFKKYAGFTAQKLNISALMAQDDDLSTFAASCTEFLSLIMTNQVLFHMNEMALNLVLYAKLDELSRDDFDVRLQQSLRIPGKGEKFADLVITVHRDTADECIYLIELKYLAKNEAFAKSSNSSPDSMIRKAAAEVSEYKTALDFKGKKVKAYVMLFAGPECIYCDQLQL